MWQQIPCARVFLREVRDAEAGIVIPATTQVLRATRGPLKIPPEGRGFLRLAMVDGIHTQQRLAASGVGIGNTRLCRFCDEEDEDALHIACTCPRWQCYRDKLYECVPKSRVDS